MSQDLAGELWISVRLWFGDEISLRDGAAKRSKSLCDRQHRTRPCKNRKSGAPATWSASIKVETRKGGPPAICHQKLGTFEEFKMESEIKVGQRFKFTLL